jgi:hypothetical protein
MEMTVMNYMSGHKLTIGETDRIARCQCNAWQWPSGYDLPEAYAKHIKQEEEREEAMLAHASTIPAGPSRLGKVGQVAVTFLVFMIFAFAMLHFIG